jgi:hypothetical protein
VGPLQRIAILTLQQLSKHDKLKAAMQKDCVPLFLTAISNFKSNSSMQHVFQVAQLGMCELSEVFVYLFIPCLFIIKFLFTACLLAYLLTDLLTY